MWAAAVSGLTDGANKMIPALDPVPGLWVALRGDHKLAVCPLFRKTDLPYVMQYCFRAVNRPSGPDFGRTATGKTSKSVLGPAFGRSEGRFWCFPGSSPAKIRPGSPISGPEALLRDME